MAINKSFMQPILGLDEHSRVHLFVLVCYKDAILISVVSDPGDWLEFQFLLP